MKRTPKHAAAGKSAIILPGIVTEQDREIVRRRADGETRKAICDALGVTVGTVQRAEWRCRNDARGRGLLVDCQDSIEGLEWIGELDGNAAHALRYRHWHYEGAEITRLSEAAALGRHYVSHMTGIGPKSLASIDRVLGLLGIAWSPVERMPKAKSREAESGNNAAQRDQYWNSILRRVAEMERTVGRAVLKDIAGRDSMEGVVYRLAFLSGYLESRLEREGKTIDVTPDPEQDDGEYETAGNLICLPGVKLASVLCNDGSDPGPSAA
jgi:hypothetical protein